jgi:hypothetical protein
VLNARRAISEGDRQLLKSSGRSARLLEAKSFGEFGEKSLTAAMADSTRAVDLEREPLPRRGN